MDDLITRAVHRHCSDAEAVTTACARAGRGREEAQAGERPRSVRRDSRREQHPPGCPLLVDPLHYCLDRLALARFTSAVQQAVAHRAEMPTAFDRGPI